MREAQGDEEEVAAMYEAGTDPTIAIPVTDQYPLGDVVRKLHSLPRRDEDSDGDDDVIKGMSNDLQGLPFYAPMQRQRRRRKRRRSRRTTREMARTSATARRGRSTARIMY